MSSDLDLYREYPELLELRKKQLAADAAKTEAEARKAEAEYETDLIAATVKKAEHAKLLQENTKLLEETENLRQLREQHALQLEIARIEVAQTKRTWEEDRAQDYWNKRYVFDAQVNDAGVAKLIRTLTQWSRTSPGCDIEIVINSPGGDVISGFAAIDFIQSLKEQGHMVRTHAIGMAASMAGVMLQAGTVRSMGPNAILLIHEASYGAIGSHGEVQDRVKLVEIMHERILTLFEDRAKPINPRTTKTFIRKNWERKDWWLAAGKAKDLGFVDEVR